MTRQRSGFVRDPLHEVPITDDAIGVVIDDFVFRAIEMCCQESLCNSHPDTVGKALAQWTGEPNDPGIWTVTVGDEVISTDYTYEVIEAEPLTQVLSGLADLINAEDGYTAQVEGNVLAVTKLEGGGLSVIPDIIRKKVFSF